MSFDPNRPSPSAEPEQHPHRASGRPQLNPGELIADRFLVERWVGRGGMGAVYKARDLATQAPAALKVLAQELPAGDDRFAREALFLARLSHPAIVRYLMHGQTESGQHFLAMEWLDGEDLSVRLGHKGLTVDETLSLARRICAGLATAHAKGFVHRDLKPSNLFLVGGAPDAAKILDFGVARDAGATRSLTRAGSVLGTIGYMAPEQAMGGPELDARADVFALGCVLFECLTGHAAFSAPHEVGVLAKVLREDPPHVSELRPGLGASLDELVAKLLAKDRALRPQDAAAVLREIDQLGPLTGDVGLAMPRRMARHVTDSEQRIASVILAQPVRTSERTLPFDQAEPAAVRVDQLSWAFRAGQVTLRGGGLCFVFGAVGGVTAADQAAQAARCALSLRSLRPELVLALATGSVTADRIPTGTAIDRASELLSRVAQPGPLIVLDAVTAGMLGGRFDVARVGGQLALMRELDTLDAPRPLMGRRTPCVGRDKELALLGATFEECVSDEVARVVLITAGSGAGKSRLGHEYLEQVRAQGSARVLSARSEPNAAGSALRLVRRLVRASAGLPESAPLATQQALLREYLGALLPADSQERALEFLGELVGVPVEAPSALLRAARNDPEVMREQTRRAFELWGTAESARRPLLLFLDDLHWGDAPSVVYLDELLQVCANRPILVLALARPEVHERFPRLWHSAGVHEVRLRGLTPRAAERLLDAVLTPEQRNQVARRIIELADGNAFYLEELIRRAAEGGTEFPETVLAMVQSRIDALSTEERRVLRAASVFGETFWAGGVDALLDSNESAAWLDSLVRSEILVPRARARFSGQQEYTFRHAFLRDAAYAMLPPGDQRIAHGLAGDWLEKVGESDARIVAYHFERSDAAHRAIPWLVRAALAAVEAGDIEGSRQLSKQGLALGASGADRGMLLLVSEYMWAWDSKSNLAHLREAIELLPRSSAHWWLALSTFIFVASAADDAAAVGPYLELAQSTPPGDELTGFRGLAVQSIASGTILVGRPDIGWALLAPFDAIDADDPRCDAVFLTRLKVARAHLGIYSQMEGRWQLSRALDWARESTAAMDAAGSASGEMTALFILGCAWLFLGGYEEATAALEKSLQHSRRSGNVLVEQYSQLVSAWALLRQGRHDEVLPLLDAVDRSPDMNVVHGAGAVRAELAYQRGDHAQALEGALRATQGAAVPYRRMAWATAARAQLALGQPEAALAAVRASADDGNVAPNLEFEIDLRTSEVRALQALGQHEHARERWRGARAFLDDAAASISDVQLREAFLTRVRAHQLLRDLGATIQRDG